MTGHSKIVAEGYISDIYKDSFFIIIKEGDEPYQEYQAEIANTEVAEYDRGKIVAGAFVEISNEGLVSFKKVGTWTKEDIQKTNSKSAEFEDWFNINNLEDEE